MFIQVTTGPTFTAPLTNHERMMINAIRTGQKDARIDSASDASTYGARPNSSWASWYKWGRDMLPLPACLTQKGVEP